ncbi:Hypothetical predicted protein [Pelobates cultripes]|uniref:Uncharacterized protein n=1 Tax=Pelobates cultripes TaxID=61616 RepID=A0AAD1VZ93_PELCU|nr:Hypothetical predicted protein [Pelobates cultripes]
MSRGGRQTSIIYCTNLQPHRTGPPGRQTSRGLRPEHHPPAQRIRLHRQRPSIRIHSSPRLGKNVAFHGNTRVHRCRSPRPVGEPAWSDSRSPDTPKPTTQPGHWLTLDLTLTTNCWPSHPQTQPLQPANMITHTLQPNRQLPMSENTQTVILQHRPGNSTH